LLIVRIYGKYIILNFYTYLVIEKYKEHLFKGGPGRICTHISDAIYNTLYGKAKFLRYSRVIYFIFCFVENKIAHVRYEIILLPNFLLEIHWPFVMKGIYVQPARATEEIRLNIEDMENSRSDQITIIGSSMLGPTFFSLRFGL
jgi:hypothetical protein